MGSGGTKMHYGGSTWSSMASGISEYLYGVWGSTGSDVFAVGAAGTILHYPVMIYLETNGICGGNEPCYSVFQSAIDDTDDALIIIP